MSFGTYEGSMSWIHTPGYYPFPSHGFSYSRIVNLAHLDIDLSGTAFNVAMA